MTNLRPHRVRESPRSSPQLGTILSAYQATIKHALTFAVVSDGGNQVARQYGLVFSLDEAVRAAHQQLGADLPAYNGEASWQLPIPATFLIDQARIVRLAFVDPDFTHRLDPSLVIAQLKRLRGELAE